MDQDVQYLISGELYIDVQIKIVNEADLQGSQVSQLRIKLTDKVDTLQKTLKDCLEGDCEIFYKGVALDDSKQFSDYKIVQNDKLLCIF